MFSPTLVAGLHGDEPLPLFAITSIGLRCVAGNPQALAHGQRFIDRDLNASFNTPADSLDYECKRAKEILEIIPTNELILDFHTFSCESPPFAIVVDRDLIPMASCLGVKHVVLMTHNIKNGGSLCDVRRCISVEVGKHDGIDSMRCTIDIIESFDRRMRSDDVQVYEVFDIISSEGQYENFKPCSDGFIPILAGEKAYSHFGLKARLIPHAQ